VRERVQLSGDISARRAAAIEATRADELSRAQRKAVAAMALFENKLGVKAGQADLIQGIARLAAQRGVRVVSQSFDEGRVQRGDAALFLELGLTGSYASLRRLLSDFATLPMWLEVVEARIERSGESGGQVRAQLRLLTYRAGRGGSGKEGL
jgi:Tfp pilus assembly protein PilO